MSKKKFLITNNNQSLRLDNFLVKNGFNFALIQKLIRKKQIKVNQKNAFAAYKLKLDDQIEIPNNLIAINESKQKNSAKKNINQQKLAQIIKAIIFKDENLIAIDKPSGIAVQGGSKIDFNIAEILSHLKFEKNEIPHLVLRLDKDTSGILLIARNRAAADILTQAFKNKTIHKTYLALVKGAPTRKIGVINIPIIKKYHGKIEKVYKDEIGGKEAITNYKLLKIFAKENCSLLELQPITGRTHQLRVHCKEIGNPIIGDGKYGGKNAFIAGRSNSLHLHAWKISLADFFGKKLLIETKLPDFANII